jgi:hypothetical protein
LSFRSAAKESASCTTKTVVILNEVKDPCISPLFVLAAALALALAPEIGPGFSPDIHNHHEIGL